MIPGLENAEFARYGVMHQTPYISAKLLMSLQAKRIIWPRRPIRGRGMESTSGPVAE